MANLITLRNTLSLEGINVLLPQQALLVKGGCGKRKKKSMSNSGSRSGSGRGGFRPRGRKCGGSTTPTTGGGAGGGVVTVPPVVIIDQA